MHLGLDLGVAGAQMLGLDLQAKGHVVKHRHVPEQRVMLKHKAHLALAHMHVGGVFTAEQNTALPWAFQPRNDAQQRGFAAAGGAEQSHQLTRGNVQVDISQGMKVAKLLADVSNFNTHFSILQANWGRGASSRGRSGGSSAVALSSRSCCHSATDLITKVTKANKASSEATANAATDWYSL